MISLIKIIPELEHNLNKYKVHFATGKNENNPLIAFFNNDFKWWQEWQTQRNFERENILSLIYYEQNRWLFAGIYKSISCKYVDDHYQYETELLDIGNDLIGRLIITFKEDFRASYLKLEKHYEKFIIFEILKERVAVTKFLGYENVNIELDYLQAIILDAKITWKTVIESEIILKRYGISYLYHMTHKDNFISILQHGLRSHNEAHKGYLKKDIADNVVNSRRNRNDPLRGRNIHDYVPLYFNPKNPMLYRRRNIQEDILILGIDANLLFNLKTIFTDGNAAAHKTSFYNSIDDIKLLNWGCINDEYWNDYTDGKRIRCAEVLVYSKIPSSLIRIVYCKNVSSLNFVKQIIINYPEIIAQQNSDMYFHSYTI